MLTVQVVMKNLACLEVCSSHIKLFFLSSLCKYMLIFLFLADMCMLNFRIFVKMSNVQFALVCFCSTFLDGIVEQ